MFGENWDAVGIDVVASDKYTIDVPGDLGPRSGRRSHFLIDEPAKEMRKPLLSLCLFAANGYVESAHSSEHFVIPRT